MQSVELPGKLVLKHDSIKWHCWVKLKPLSVCMNNVQNNWPNTRLKIYSKRIVPCSSNLEKNLERLQRIFERSAKGDHAAIEEELAALEQEQLSASRDRGRN